MPLCFIEPQDAIRVIAESVGREARRQLVGEVVRAWVDDIPDQELSLHYAKAIADLDEEDLHLLAAWHASLEVGQPIANPEFLVGVFPSLGENRREALKIAAGFRGEEAFQAGVAEDQALDTVLPRLSQRARRRARQRVHPALHLGPPGLRELDWGSMADASQPQGQDADAPAPAAVSSTASSLGPARRAGAAPRADRSARAQERAPEPVAEQAPPVDEAPAGPAAASASSPGEQAPAADGGSVPAPSEEDVMDALANVIDPELGLDFVELGLIYGVEMTGGDVRVTFTLTTPACPIGPQRDRTDRRIRGRTGRRQERLGRDGLHPPVVAGADVRGREVRARVLDPRRPSPPGPRL